MKRIALFYFLTCCTFQLTAQGYIDTLESFEDNRAEWTVGDKEESSAQIKDGAYFIERKTSGSQGWWQDFPCNPRHEYSIEATLTHVDGATNYGFGLIFGKFNWEDYYTFLISSNGSSKIWGKKDAKKVTLMDWTKLGNINPSGIQNIFKISHDGETTSFFLNDSLIHQEKGLQIVGKQVGFKVEGAMKIKIDEIKVRYYQKPIVLSENHSTGRTLINLGMNVNTEYSETSPFITADGKRLYYIIKDHPNNIQGAPDDIWVSNFVNGEWTKATNIGKPLNNSGNNVIISITPDGNKALVSGIYKEDGSSIGGGVSISYYKDGKWQLPISQKIIGFNNEDEYGTRIMSADGTKLILSLDDGQSYGNTDLYVCFLDEDGTWSVPMNMGPVINSFMSEFAPFLAADGKTIYFSSYGHPGYGSADIFTSKRLDDSWQNWTEPQNLGPEINSADWEGYYVLSAKADYGYLGASKDDGYGSSDIYKIETHESSRPDPVILIYGKTIDGKSGKAINAEIFYENLGTGKQEGIAISTIENGYKIVIPKGAVYGFMAQAEGFMPVSQNIDTKTISEFGELQVDLVLVPIESGQKISLNNTFFKTGESELTEESILELKRISEIIKDHPELRFQIAGHTDDTGGKTTNLSLSEQRAKAVYDYLISNGVPRAAIVFRGYGETQPIHDNDTEEGRQKNRRVEIIIL